jgi:hypothetical protein
VLSKANHSALTQNSINNKRSVFDSDKDIMPSGSNWLHKPYLDELIHRWVTQALKVAQLHMCKKLANTCHCPKDMTTSM